MNIRMRGVTLVELIVAIVIMGTALAGLAAVYARASVASADPLVTQQMLAIGESLMEEILLKNYGNDTPVPGKRAAYTHVGHYNGYGKDAKGILDVEGAAIAGLERYGVLVTVEQVALTGIAADQAQRIRVVVSNGGESLRLTGWRTKP